MSGTTTDGAASLIDDLTGAANTAAQALKSLPGGGAVTGETANEAMSLINSIFSVCPPPFIRGKTR